MSSEPKNAAEAVACTKDLMEQEYHSVENKSPLGKGFHGGRQGQDPCRRTAKTTVISCWIQSESAKDQFTDKEYEWLKESAKISNIENRLTMMEEKYTPKRHRNLRMAL